MDSIDAGGAGVALLGGDDFLDVLDVGGEGLEFAEHVVALGRQMGGEIGQISRQLAAFGAGEEAGKIGGVFLEEGGESW